MPEETVDLIVNQLGIQDETALDAVLAEAATGTVWAKAAQTKNSIFFTIYTVLIRTPFSFCIALIRALVPQIYTTYKTGEFLNQDRIDHALDAFIGLKAVHQLTLTKEAAVDLTIDPNTVFYVDENNPRRFQTLVLYEFSEAEESVLIDVEAVEIGLVYNVGQGLITKCETALPVLTISNDSSAPKQPGADPETPAELRARIHAIKGQQIRPGMELFYENVLLSVGAVTSVTLDEVTDDGIQYYTIYGAGPLDGSVTAEAQAAIDEVLIFGDQAVVIAASSQLLELTMQIDAEYNEATVTAAIDIYFASVIPRRTNFESSILFSYLQENVSGLAGVAMRCVPVHLDLENGKYFTPDMTYEPFGT